MGSGYLKPQETPPPPKLIDQKEQDPTFTQVSSEGHNIRATQPSHFNPILITTRLFALSVIFLWFSPFNCGFRYSFTCCRFNSIVVSLFFHMLPVHTVMNELWPIICELWRISHSVKSSYASGSDNLQIFRMGSARDNHKCFAGFGPR